MNATLPIRRRRLPVALLTLALAGATVTPSTVDAQSVMDVEGARHNARAGGAVSGHDRWIIQQYGATSGTNSRASRAARRVSRDASASNARARNLAREVAEKTEREPKRRPPRPKSAEPTRVVKKPTPVSPARTDRTEVAAASLVSDGPAADGAKTLTTSEMTPTSAVDTEDASKTGVPLGADANPAFSR